MTVRVLSLSGGGMRGLYSVEYLANIEKMFRSKHNKNFNLDIGKGFNLIAGTSTGAIIACGLAAGVRLENMVSMYRERGKSIFPLKLELTTFGDKLRQFFLRKANIEKGQKELVRALKELFSDKTLGEIYKDRQIALALTAVRMATHDGYIFKTSHLPNSSKRDDEVTLVNACLASSAAPIYRSIERFDAGDGVEAFADGGLWANNPVLVGLIDALSMGNEDEDIEIFCLGTCDKPVGEIISEDKVHRGLFDWKCGGKAVELSISAQQKTQENMARLLIKHIKRPIKIYSFPTKPIPSDFHKHLDLDVTDEKGLDALASQARGDKDFLNELIGKKNETALAIEKFFTELTKLD